MIDNKALSNFVFTQFPENIITFILQSIVLIYQDSYDYVFTNFEKEQAIDLLCNYRRGKIESFLKLLPNRFPELNVECKINDSFNSHHIEIGINNIVFTQSFTQFQDEKVRKAIFRNDLSEFNEQFELEFPEYPIQEKSKKCYAILNHGADGREPKRPQFFQLIFPPSNSENIAAPIDLMKLYNIPANILQAEIEVMKSKNDLINPPLKNPGKTGESNNNEHRAS